MWHYQCANTSIHVLFASWCFVPSALAKSEKKFLCLLSHILSCIICFLCLLCVTILQRWVTRNILLHASGYIQHHVTRRSQDSPLICTATLIPSHLQTRMKINLRNVFLSRFWALLTRLPYTFIDQFGEKLFPARFFFCNHPNQHYYRQRM